MSNNVIQAFIKLQFDEFIKGINNVLIFNKLILLFPTEYDKLYKLTFVLYKRLLKFKNDIFVKVWTFKFVIEAVIVLRLDIQALATLIFVGLNTPKLKFWVYKFTKEAVFTQALTKLQLDAFITEFNNVLLVTKLDKFNKLTFVV